ncbi:transposase [Vibrio azureus]|uniref:Transposase IS200-like domain-containing protein n=2 Tax=Vibrio azureus TaxID=512649 RepID=U3CEH2_9VIBR|nr:transposase [Vibrio azureus]AUI86172.1 transposase [Vibrio azureus]GAD76718.1 hypothetical protein VAZ01S_050_00300 [Vibrio azureus NBRC 104587]
MTVARTTLINIEATPYYHCISRCVRRSFLCGYDQQTNACFEHRRGWIEKRLLQLAQVFCIDVCAYAIMSNHYHVVLHVNSTLADTLSLHQVAARWLSLHRTPELIRRFLSGDTLSEPELACCKEMIEQWRTRLTSISWFMKLLNQHIAFKANQEDECKGHFWEGRFKSQALLDEKALAAAMAYVDLNPVRANLANTPEESEFTSVKTRIEALRDGQPSSLLFPFTEESIQDPPQGLPFQLLDYLELVDWTARQIRSGKQGYQDARLPSILQRLGLDHSHWLTACHHIEKGFFVGTDVSIKASLPFFNRQKVTGFRLS